MTNKLENEFNYEELSEMHNNFVAPTYGNRGLFLEKAEGVYLYDSNGKRYLDCFSNMGVNVLGHNNKEIKEAIIEQLNLITNLHGSYMNSKRAIFSKMLCEKSGLDKVFFCNSGAEAVEAAIKFARLATGKKEILGAKMGYHGKTIGALSLTKTMPKYNEPFLPLLQHVNHFSYDDVESLKSVITEDTAAVILEPIQGEGGIRLPHDNFFKEVRKICDEKNILLIIDEIQTGFGRTGKLFAIEHFGIKPDIMCLAKGISGGLPAGAVLINNKVSEKLYPGCHTNTFGGNPLISAAGIAVLQYIEKNNLLKNAEDVGNYFLDKLKKLNKSVIREVRGKGLMIAIELKTKNTEYTKKLQENGLIVIPTLSNVIRLLPPIIFSKENVEEAVSVLENSL
ncbi:MAG: aspartate aminotransferase family protein [Candidatus Woesearchaeota archaeon]